MNTTTTTRSTEKEIAVLGGGLMLPVTLGLLFGGPALMITLGVQAEMARQNPPLFGMLAGAAALVLGIFTCPGFFTLEPKQGRLLLLFGNYLGTVKRPGFYWTNPFNTKTLISLRSRNLEGEQLKVNDKRGNPIEIAVVVVWHVSDTAQASFDVENYEEYVKVQSESAVRDLASRYAYDDGDQEEKVTLRGHAAEVSVSLKVELEERLAKAGVVIEEARLTHLAYAPEIAGAMLRRQQAEAVIAARTKIVQGAVSMVELALKHIEANGIVKLDDERKAAMVSNLLVVLCGEADVHPVINAGTLYG